MPRQKIAETVPSPADVDDDPLPAGRPRQLVMKPLARCPNAALRSKWASLARSMLPLGLTVSAVTRLELDEHLPDVWSSAETAPITAAGKGSHCRPSAWSLCDTQLGRTRRHGRGLSSADTRFDALAQRHLAQEPAQQAERRKRFEREARAVSSLNHPHICTLYDVGCHDGIDFLVMEFVEGETLAHRLKKGPLSFDQVLRYAIQMTDALSDAHRHAIMHRDLKPGNIMLAKSGAKLLDFGLAKMLAATRPREAATIHADTETLTQKQTIVGTLAYMAPEQLDGAEADARSDIFALGAVIFEMATGRRAFDAKNRADLVASIKTANPPSILTFHNMAHRALDYTVRTCLAKDPDARWQSSHDVLLELKRIGETISQIGVGGAASPPTPKLRHRRIFSAVGSVAAVCVAIAFFLHSQAPPPARPSKFAILPPGEFEAPVISFDGRHIAYVLLHSNDPTTQRSGDAEETTRRLYVQDLDHEKPREIEGSEGAHLPFWSFDSKFIAFAARNHMWKANVGAGTPIPICDISSEFLGGTWSLDGRSVIFSAHRQGIYEVSAGGGTPRMLVPEDQSTFGQHFDTPKLLPASTGERELLYATVQKNAAIHDIVVQSLASGTRRLLVPAANRPVYSPSGHVLYVSLADNIQLLMALPFSLNSMTATGTLSDRQAASLL